MAASFLTPPGKYFTNVKVKSTTDLMNIIFLGRIIYLSIELCKATVVNICYPSAPSTKSALLFLLPSIVLFNLVNNKW